MSRTSNILPHGLVSVANIQDMAIRDALRKLAENIVALEKKIVEQERGKR